MHAAGLRIMHQWIIITHLFQKNWASSIINVGVEFMLKFCLKSTNDYFGIGVINLFSEFPEDYGMEDVCWYTQTWESQDFFSYCSLTAVDNVFTADVNVQCHLRFRVWLLCCHMTNQQIVLLTPVFYRLLVNIVNLWHCMFQAVIKTYFDFREETCLPRFRDIMKWETGSDINHETSIS